MPLIEVVCKLGFALPGSVGKLFGIAFHWLSVCDKDKDGSMARLTWLSMNWKSRQALRGRRRAQAVSPGGNGGRVADQLLHQQSHEQLAVQPGPGAVLVVLG